jgi:hypothetical protein
VAAYSKPVYHIGYKKENDVCSSLWKSIFAVCHEAKAFTPWGQISPGRGKPLKENMLSERGHKKLTK